MLYGHLSHELLVALQRAGVNEKISKITQEVGRTKWQDSAVLHWTQLFELFNLETEIPH